MEKNPTGHLCIHKEQGDRHYCFFNQGNPLGVYDIEKHWSLVDISTMWEGAKQVDYYLSAGLESFLAKAKGMSLSDDLRKFIVLWNEMMEEIAKKIGKKPVEKSLQRNFGGLNNYALEGIRLQLVGTISRNSYATLEELRLTVPDFLKEMETITGGRWLNDQLVDFQERNSGIIARLSLTDVFPVKGD